MILLLILVETVLGSSHCICNSLYTKSRFDAILDCLREHVIVGILYIQFNMRET